MPPDPIPDRLRPPLQACASGTVPANIGLLRLLIEAQSQREADEALAASSRAEADASARERLDAARRLLDENPQAFGLVKSVLRDVEHHGTASDAEGGVAHWAGAFDRMARAAPEGAVALYALGNPRLLEQATREVVDYLRNRTLVDSASHVLEIGCGIGRFVEALAPDVAQVTGLDIAPAMIDEARRRCAGHANVVLRVSSGHDLAPVEDESVDLVLAADVFPYLVHAGPDLVEKHLHEARRVLRRGGSLVILNYSYRDDPAQDEADLRRLAGLHGLTPVKTGERPFSLWDAAVFHLARKA
jgi:SAM-dependent methyltransferase